MGEILKTYLKLQRLFLLGFLVVHQVYDVQLPSATTILESLIDVFEPKSYKSEMKTHKKILMSVLEYANKEYAYDDLERWLGELIRRPESVNDTKSMGHLSATKRRLFLELYIVFYTKTIDDFPVCLMVKRDSYALQYQPVNLNSFRLPIFEKLGCILVKNLLNSLNTETISFGTSDQILDTEPSYTYSPLNYEHSEMIDDYYG